MNKRPFILITNDDGIHAPGILHLWNALVEVFDVAIIAPSSEQSGVGAGITLRAPIQIDPWPWNKATPAWKVSGTPADCVRMGLSVILDRKPDLIVSGINRGSNSGRTALFSGTVGGVIEGALRNIPGIAFSWEEYFSSDYSSIEPYITPIVDYVLTHSLPNGTLLNVNIPSPRVGEIKGIKLASQGKGYYIEDPEKRLHPDGYPYYWLSGKWSEHEEEKGSDNALLQEGYITAVPIHVGSMTDDEHLKKQKLDFESKVNENLSISKKGHD